MKEIASKLGVSIDAVCYFMRKYKLPRRTYSEEAKIRFKNKAVTFKIASTLHGDMEYLRQAGVMLYWCEGAKYGKNTGIDFANSDPQMLTVFMSFLRNICGVDEKRLRVYLYCYANQEPEKCIEYWSKVLTIPVSQFTKPYVRQDFNIEKTGKMPQGMVHIRYSDKKLYSILMQWLEEYKQKYASIV